MFEFTIPSEELKVLKDKIMNIYQELKKESDDSWEIITTSSIGTSNSNAEMDHYHELLGKATAYDKVLRALEDEFPFLKE